LVELAAGASVVLITKRSEMTKTVQSRISGRTIPSPTTTIQPVRSPGFGPAVSRPMPRRLERFQANRSRPTTSASPIQAPPIIHQKRLAMSFDW